MTSKEAVVVGTVILVFLILSFTFLGSNNNNNSKIPNSSHNNHSPHPTTTTPPTNNPHHSIPTSSYCLATSNALSNGDFQNENIANSWNLSGGYASFTKFAYLGI